LTGRIDGAKNRLLQKEIIVMGLPSNDFGKWSDGILEYWSDGTEILDFR
jgi:hypothetical protein